MPARSLAAVLLAVAAAFPLVALASSGNPSGISGLTPKSADPGCKGCHGETATSSLSVSISGPQVLAADASAVYTVTATRSGTADGTRMGMAVAASPSPTALSVVSGTPTVLDAASGEVIHSTGVGPLRTTTGGTASYEVRFTMPAGTAPATAHTLYAVARFAGTNWQLAPNFSVTTPPSNPSTLTSPGKGATSVQLAWTGGGPQYRVVVKPGSTPPANASDGTTIDVGTATSTAVPGLQPLTTYAFAVYSRTTGIEAYSAGAATLVVTTTDLIAQLPISLYAGGNTAGDGGPVANAVIGAGKMARDTAGNLYIADWANNRIRKVATNGIVTTVAGTGLVGFSGDGGPATQASFSFPWAVAADSAGNLYILDRFNYRIRKFTAATGVITTIAGTGTAGYSGDNGPATSARIGATYGVAVDGSGNVYFSDFARVRRITPGGTISTYAGNGTLGGATNNVLATAATLNQPEGLAVDGAGNLYIADRNNSRVRKVTAATGIITNYAGSGTSPFTPESGPATTVYIGSPTGVSFDAAGNLLIADDLRYLVWRVTTSTGNVAIAAGTKSPFPGCEANGLGALSTCFLRAIDVNVAPDGGILVMDEHRLRKVNPSTGVVSAYTSGTDPTAYTGDGGPAAAAFLYSASGLAMDAQDRLHITESLRPLVRRVNPATLAIETAGNYPSVDATGLAGVAISPVGSLVAAMPGRHAIVEFPEGGTPGVYAGLYGTFTDCGTSSSPDASFYQPTGLARDREGRLLVVERVNNCVKRLAIVNGVPTWTRIAGSSFFARGFAGDGGPATSASLDYPTGIAEDREGNLFIADGGNHRVRRVDAATGNISTLAGDGTAGFAGDGGAAAAARLSKPSAVAVDMAGNVYVADQDNHRVRKVSVASGTIATVAGNGTAGVAGDGGSAGLANLASPTGLAFDAAGNLYVADSGSGRVRKVATTASVLLSVTPPTGVFGDSVQLTATVTDGADTPAGTVFFRDGENDLCTGTIAAGVVTCTTTALAAGAHTLTAVYGGGLASLAGRSLQTVRSVAQAAQSIAFAALADRALGSPAFTVSATVPVWGTTVTFTSLTPAVCSATGTNGATVTLLAAGTCTIAADAVGTANLLAAPQVQQSFNVSIIPPITSYTLVVASVSGGNYGTGTVTSSPAGINGCVACSAQFPAGTVVTLSATPGSPGSIFAGWSGDCTGTGTCVVTMSVNRNVTTAFPLVVNTGPVSLTVAKAGSGSGTVSSAPAGIDCGVTCTAVYGSGASVTLTAIPASGSVFSGWSGACTGTGTCNVTMSAARNVTATFTKSFDLSVGKVGVGTGVVTSTPAGINCGRNCVAPFADGTVVALAASANAGSTFVGWGGACAGTGACNVTMDTARSVTATFSTPNANIPRLGNISTRLQVQTGNSVLIGGFVIGGAQAKTVVVRARGPSLAPFGITNVLADPKLELFAGQTPIDSNDDWKAHANADLLKASGFAPDDAKEAAIYTTLGPGDYTAIVSGVGGTIGVGIVEVVEVDLPQVPLINISTRGSVLTGDDVMIGGFIINGTSPQTVLIRARGPSLGQFGIANPLADPTLELVIGTEVITSNDNWPSAPNAAAIQATGKAPIDPRESAILVTLFPGAYTAIVRGAGGTTGVGIIEVFAQ